MASSVKHAASSAGFESGAMHGREGSQCLTQASRLSHVQLQLLGSTAQVTGVDHTVYQSTYSPLLTLVSHLEGESGDGRLCDEDHSKCQQIPLLNTSLYRCIIVECQILH